MRTFFCKALIYCLLILIPLSAFPQEEPEAVEQNRQALDSKLNTLRTLLASIAEKEADLQQAVLALKKADTAEQGAARESVDEAEAELQALRAKLESIATGIAVEAYRSSEPDRFDLQEEIENLLQPMIYALKSVTQDSRQIEHLKQSIESVTQKEAAAAAAVEHLQEMLGRVEDEQLAGTLQSLLENWQKEQASLADERSILNQQLQQKLESKESIISSTGELLTGFFQSRGVNFLLGVLTFFAVFLLLRFIHRLLKYFSTRKKSYKKSSFERLTELVFLVFSLLLSASATLFVFNLRNDWLLLGLSVLFLIALGWVLIKSLPAMVEQIMLLLDLGSVREGERVIYNGVPWLVQSLSFYSHFVNPVLTGGSMHISVRELVGLVSRPSAPNEEWFPSKEGDWVKLDDETIGKVVYQSPEMVQLSVFGGSSVTYATGTYIGLNPRNLSDGFRIQMVFGIDYRYQDLCTTEIPAKMKAMLTEDLIELLGEDELVRIETDFFQPNASSLDFEYEAYVKGSSAHQYEEIERTMIYSFANACNKHGWEIPFQQVTLNQRAAS